MTPPHLTVILNPRSGRTKGRRRKAEIVRKLLARRGVEHTVLETEYAGHATKLASEAAAAGCPVVVAYGGDGTLNEVASGLVGTDTALGVIPAGSGNGMARGLRIPCRLRRAVDIILRGHTLATDVGTVNGEYFFNVFGLGYEAYLSDLFRQEAGNVRGQLPYFVLGARAYFSYRAQKITVEVEGESVEIQPFTLTIANGSQYGTGARIAPEADFADGYLDMVQLDVMPLREAVAAFPRLFTGSFGRIRGRHHRRVREAVIRASSPPTVQFDGEARRGAEVMRVSLLPKALRIIVPGA